MGLEAASTIIGLIFQAIDVANAIKHCCHNYKNHYEVQQLRQEVEQIAGMLEMVEKSHNTDENREVYEEPLRGLILELQKIREFLGDLPNQKRKILKLLSVDGEIKKLRQEFDRVKGVFNIGSQMQILYVVDQLGQNLRMQTKYINPEISLREITDKKVLHTGENGIVYSAKYEGDPVAVKVLHQRKHLAQDAKLQFAQEVRMASSKAASNIVRFYGACTQPGQEAIVMELMKGNLHKLLHESQIHLPWRKRLSMAKEIASGLASVHMHVIVHRNINSFNILHDADYRCKLTDFGIARYFNDFGSNNEKRGLAAWNAPEHPEFTDKSDIYSFGIVLWEIAARKKPFQHLNDEDIRRLVRRKEREKMELCEPGMPPDYGKIILECWADSPDDRPELPSVIERLEEMEKRQPDDPMEQLMKNLQLCWGKEEFQPLIEDFKNKLAAKVNPAP